MQDSVNLWQTTKMNRYVHCRNITQQIKAANDEMTMRSGV